MYYEIYLGVESFGCMICGNRIYPGFPRRNGEPEQKNIKKLGKKAKCPVCKKIYEISKQNQIYCSIRCRTKMLSSRKKERSMR